MSTNYSSTKFGIFADAGGVSPPSDRYPYLKYTWTASFEFMDNSFEDSQILETVTLKTVELPRWTIDTQIVNAYNHKVMVQTKLNYEPITMSFYDQQNDSVEKMLWHYVKGQFEPNDASKANTIRPMRVFIKMHKHHMGPTDGNSEMTTSNEDASKQKIYKLENAFIVDAQHDTLDYSTSDVILWTLTLRYEKLEWIGGFEGEPSRVDTGVSGPPEQFPSPPKDIPTPASFDIPDAAPGLMEMEGFSGGDVNYGAVNYKPTSLSKVLDERASREKAAKQIATPGSNSEPAYTGYESAFVPTPPGPTAQGFNASSGRAGSSSNSGAPAAARNTDSSVSSAATAAKSAEPSSFGSSESGQIKSTTDTTRAPVNRKFQEAQDDLKARQTGKSVAEIRAARAKNLAELDKKTPNWD